MSYTEIQYTVEHFVLTILLNQPAKLKALTMTMIDELCDAHSQASKDDEVRVIVITGNGPARYVTWALRLI